MACVVEWVREQAENWQGDSPLSEYAKCQAVVAILQAQGIKSQVEVGDVHVSRKRKPAEDFRFYAFMLEGASRQPKVHDCRGFTGWDDIVLNSLPAYVGPFEWSFTSYLDTKWAVVAALAKEPVDAKKWIAHAPQDYEAANLQGETPKAKQKRRRFSLL